MFDPKNEMYYEFEEQRKEFIKKFHNNPTNGKVTLYLLRGCFIGFLVWLLIVLCLLASILIQLGVI